MKKTLRLFALLALFSGMIALPANSASARDNTFNFTGTFGLVNPCNGELVSGPIDIYIVVSTTQTGNGETKVKVHHNSHGTLSDAERLFARFLGTPYVGGRVGFGRLVAHLVSPR